MVLVNRNVASFNTIIEILQNDQRKIKLIRKYENTQKKIINNECAILFNKTCINERLLPKYIYIYIYIYKCTHYTVYTRIKCIHIPHTCEYLIHYLPHINCSFPPTQQPLGIKSDTLRQPQVCQWRGNNHCHRKKSH